MQDNKKKLILPQEMLSKFSLKRKFQWINIQTRDGRIFKNLPLHENGEIAFTKSANETTPFELNDISSIEKVQTKERIKKGDRFIVLRDLKTTGIIAYSAPGSSSFDCVLPKGLVLIASYNQDEDALGAWLIPEDYEKWKKVFSPETNPSDDTWSYAFSFEQDDIGDKILRL